MDSAQQNAPMSSDHQVDSCSSNEQLSQISPFAKPKSQQHAALSMLPISSNLANALSNNSSRGSLASVSTLPLNTSISTSPDTLLAYSQVSTISVPITLTESSVTLTSPMSPPSAFSAMSEAMALSKSPTSLIRRFSRGAHSKIGRRRPSNTSAKRDQSSGPVIMRRRSNSYRSFQESTLDVSDLELDYNEDAIEDLDDPSPHSGHPRLRSRPSIASNFSGDSLAPVVPALLALGTTLTKITKRQKKRLFFRLDVDAGKFFWDPYKYSKQVYIDDVQAVRSGSEVREYREAFQYAPDVENRWFTIFYTDPDRTKNRNEVKTMHLLADDERTKTLWIEWIDRIQRLRIQTMTDIAKGGEKSLKGLWRRETRSQVESDFPDPEPTVDYKAVKSMCRSLNIHCSDVRLRDQFNRADGNHIGALKYSQFRSFVKRLQKRQDIKQIFTNINQSGQNELDLQSFLQFLRVSQGIDVDSSPSRWINLFEKFCKRCRDDGSSVSVASATAMTMNFSAFQDLMMSSSVSEAISSKITGASFNRPLNEYFISSSHNTYLNGRQVYDDCSTEAYVSALNRGCRCVEIDCWDGPDGKPLVRHGHSFTTPVLFSDCIFAINEHAFRSSEYPLIISLEVHTNAQQQAKMAEIMKNVFGGKLVTTPIDDNDKKLPSPEQLKKRILIKVKASLEELNLITQSTEPFTSRLRDSPVSAKPIDIRSIDAFTIPLSSPPSTSPPDSVPPIWLASRGRDHMPSSSITPLSPSSSAEESDVVSEKKKKKPQSNIVPVLGDLGVYCKGMKFTEFRAPQAKTFNHIFSFAENTFEKYCNEYKHLLENHNMQYLMRTYPKNVRILSDNFNPLSFWRRGVQMCAMNWQTNDLGMQLNDAMFAGGDDVTGYVLKPHNLRPSDTSEAPDCPSFKKLTKKRVTFSIDIISAHRLPRPRNMAVDEAMNPFIEFEVFTPEDKDRTTPNQSFEGSPYNGPVKGHTSLKLRTNIVEDNGYDPRFVEPMKMTIETKYPSLVFVRWTVHNSVDGKTYLTNSPPLASFTAKLESLQQGYRHIPLNNAASERYYFSTLFCRINKEPIVSIGGIDIDDRDIGLNSNEGRAGIFRRVFARTPSLRKKENRETAHTSAPATIYPQTSSGVISTVHRTTSADGSLHEAKSRRS